MPEVQRSDGDRRLDLFVGLMHIPNLEPLPPMDRSKWREVQFGDVVRCVDEICREPQSAGLTRVVGLEHLDPGELRIGRWAEIADGTSFTRVFRKGQVLFGKRRAYQRKAALANFDGVCSGDILVFDAIPNMLHPNLLPFLVQSDFFFNHATSTSAGSLSPRTKWKELQKFRFTLPSIQDQARIESVLNCLTGLLAEYKSVEESLRLLRSSVIESDQNVSTEWKTMVDVANIRSGIAKNSNRTDGRVKLPYLRVANVQDGFIDISDIQEIDVAPSEVNRFLLSDGDVLITEGGDFDKLGRGAVWNGEIDPCVHQNHVFCIRPDQNQILSSYLSMHLSSAKLRSYFLNCAKKTSNLATINMKQVRACPICVPPMDVQRSVVDRIELIDRGISQVGTQRNRLLSVGMAWIEEMLIKGTPNV